MAPGPIWRGYCLAAVAALGLGGSGVAGAAPAAPPLRLVLDRSWGPLVEEVPVPPVSLTNGGFEELAAGAPLGWQRWGAGLLRDEREAHSGRASGYAQVPEGAAPWWAPAAEAGTGAGPTLAAGAFWAQPLTGLVPGARYVLSGWVAPAEEESVAFLGLAMGQAGAPEGRLVGLSGVAGWTQVRFPFSAPERGSVWVLAGAARGAVRWDDLQLTAVDQREQQAADYWLAQLQTEGLPYTGLVVDARGLGLQRGMSPRILAEDGEVLYAGLGAPDELVIRRGVVSYATSWEEAIAHPRLAVGSAFPFSRPLVVRASRLAAGLLPTSVVLDTASAWLVRTLDARHHFLARYAVVFLVDPPGRGPRG